MSAFLNHLCWQRHSVHTQLHTVNTMGSFSNACYQKLCVGLKRSCIKIKLRLNFISSNIGQRAHMYKICVNHCRCKHMYKQKQVNTITTTNHHMGHCSLSLLAYLDILTLVMSSLNFTIYLYSGLILLFQNTCKICVHVEWTNNIIRKNFNSLNNVL